MFKASEAFCILLTFSSFKLNNSSISHMPTSFRKWNARKGRHSYFLLDPQKGNSLTLAGTSVFVEVNLKRSVDSRLPKEKKKVHCKHSCCFFARCYVIRGIWKSEFSKRRGLLTGEGSLSALCKSLNNPVPMFIGIPIMIHSDTPETGPQEKLKPN